MTKVALAASIAWAALLSTTLHIEARRPEEEMHERQTATLRKMMETVNAADPAAYARLYSPDAVITIYGTATLAGRAAIEQHEVQLMREFPGARLAFYSAWHHERAAVVHYAVNAPAGDGRSMGHEGLLFFRFDESGLIEEERRYQDSLTPMAQLGLFGGIPTRPQPALAAAMTTYTRPAADQKRLVSILKNSLKALDARNKAAFLAAWSEHPTVNDLMLTAPYSGRPDVERWFDLWTAAIPHAHTEVVAATPVDRFVLAETIVRGTFNADLGNVPASGKPIAAHRAIIAEFNGGKIARLTFFSNGREVNPAASSVRQR